MKTVCASEMAGILTIIENCFRSKCPRIISMGFLSTQKLFENFDLHSIYFDLHSIYKWRYHEICEIVIFTAAILFMQIRCFRSGYFDGNIPILKEEIHTVILIPLWLCPGGGGGGCTWDPGGPRTKYIMSLL